MSKPALLLLLAALALGMGACRQKAAPAAVRRPFALIETTLGTITVELLADKAPKTVAHFAALAQGKKAWRDPRDGRVRYDPLYDGLVFHRVIPGFMIQTGDPSGRGDGGIGVTVPDEIDPQARFDSSGQVGMASFGPGTNSSQFFISVGPGAELNGRNTLFGKVVRGLDVAVAISKAPRDRDESSNRPLKPVRIKKLTIVDRLE